MDEILEYKFRGAQIRARAQRDKEGEKCSKFFLSLEKSKQANNAIACLKENNREYSNTSDILRIISFFYKELYTSNPKSEATIDTYLQDIDHHSTLNMHQNEI